jgi:ABC-2 type transport system ATP-binding protein
MATAVESLAVSRPALAAEAVTKRYGARTALHEVSFTAPRGELLALLGPNGAGKTTLLSILAGVQKPTSGRLGHRTESVGWVPQTPSLYAKLSVRENLRLFARLERVADTEAAVERMVSETGLAERADEEVSRLSGGNRQRVNVAIGLLAAPPALLLDEPSSSLDPAQRARLWEFVAARAAEGTTVLYSTHDVREAERHADRVLVLADGRLLFAGTPGELHRAEPTEPGADFEAAFVAFLAFRAR